MDGTKITRQRDGRVESYMADIKITCQRMKNQIVSTKITCPRVGQCKNNSPKDGESNSKHENNSPKGWTVQKELAKEMDRWRVKWSVQ